MLWLKASIVVMSVLIVAGVTVIAVTFVNRMSSVPAGNASAVVPPVVLDEPAGTHIAGTSMGADRLALLLQGGGPDRVVVLDLRGGHVVGRVNLAH